MSDQGVHEIQLNGKQLVFMFMTATVAAVVIFLCGVMVGRGVDTTRLSGATVASANTEADPTSSTSTSPVPAADTGAPAEPVSAQEVLKDLSYHDRLEAPEPAPEPAVEPVAVPVPAIAPDAPPPAVTPTAAREPAREKELGEPKGNGFVVQVASLRSRGEADAIARRLSSKGFPAFVSSGGPRVFRVRVGKFDDRREADVIARRLEKEEQFKPWITR
jgi:cell division septation protein DedD